MITCVVCGQGVTSKRGLAFHIKKHGIESVSDYLSKYPEEMQHIEPKDDTLLTCPICGRYNMKQLGQHIVGTHKMSHEDFQKQYPEQKMFIEEISDRCRKATAIGLKQYYKNKEANPDAYAERIRIRTQKRIENNPDIGSKVASILRQKGVYEQTSKRTRLMWKDETYIKMQSDKCKRQHENGLTEKVLEKSGKRRYKITLGEKIYSMRSTWEMDFARFLYENNVDFVYEGVRIPYTYNNKNRSYVPDFIVNDTILFEVKPLSLITKELNEIKRQASINNGYVFRYITEEELSDKSKIDLTGCY